MASISEDHDTDGDGGNGNDDTSGDDISSMIEFQVYKAMQKLGTGVRMDGDSFKELSVDAKKAWSRLSSKDKAVILKASEDDTNTRKVNVAESEMVSEDQESEHGESEGKTEVNVAQSDPKSKAHPGNINRMLSSSANSKGKDKDKKKSSSSTSRSVNTVKWQVSNVNWAPTDNEDSDDEEYGKEPPPLLSRPNDYYSSSSDEESDSEDEGPPPLQAHRSSNGSVYSDSEDDSLPDLKEAAPGMSSSEEEEDGDETEGQWKAYATKFDDPWEDVDYVDNEHEESDFGWGG
jgi:hypothetical protein